MAQIIIWRRAEQQGNNLIARLDSIKVKTFYEFDSGRLRLRTDYTTAEQRVRYVASRVGTTVAAAAELQAAENDFRAGSGIENFVRGKHLFVFFVDAIEAIRNAIPVLFARFASPPDSTGGLGYGNAMMLLGPRTRCPASLRLFLERNYVGYMMSALQS